MTDAKYVPLAQRFVASYTANHAGHPHALWVICNGGDPTPPMKAIFKGVPCQFFPRGNEGWDIGAFQEMACNIVESNIACDFVVCFGSSTYLRRPGWMTRMVEAFQRHGDTLYGAMGNCGDAIHNVSPHLRSTAFWLSPKLFVKYPYSVATEGTRYQFEHGPSCLTSWIREQGKTPWMVVFSGEFQLAQWDHIPNGFHRGDQSDLLAGDRISEPPFYHTP